MRFFTLAFFIIAALQEGSASASIHTDRTQTFTVDTVHSNVGFSITHIYVEHVTGSVPILNATVIVPSGSLVPTSISAMLDPKRIETHDPDRNGVLQGPEWFDTKRFPTWNFTSKAITGKTDGRGFIVNGMLTMHGVTQPVTLDATTTRAERNLRVHATGHIDRHAFNMHITPMDGTIGKDVDLSLDILLQVQAESKEQ